ncbi:MAG: hypothetical protein D3924_16370, partial [Candidatus Electrothrix sp. AR4]|nr:hypothetical protein [Candidatus Electrothrix sp. AR4]
SLVLTGFSHTFNTVDTFTIIRCFVKFYIYRTYFMASSTFFAIKYVWVCLPFCWMGFEPSQQLNSS